MPTLKTYSKVQRVVEYSTIFSDPIANKRNLSDDSIANSIVSVKGKKKTRNSTADGDGSSHPLSSTLKNPEDKRLIFKPFDSNMTESSNAKDDVSRISTRSSKKKATAPKQNIRLFTSDAEDEDQSAQSQADTLTENSQPAGPKKRLKKTQSASDIHTNAPKLKSIMKKPVAKKVELKSKLKKKAALHMQQTAETEVVEKPEPATSDKKDESVNDENEKPKKPAAAKRAPRMLAIISDKDDLLKHVVCDNKTKYTTTTSTPQFRRRKLKVQEDLSIICKTDSPQPPQNN